MSEVPNEFDDPALKQAVRRAFGSDEAAPAALRQRVGAVMSAGLAPAPASTGETIIRRPDRSWWRRQLTLRTGIAAAVAVLAIGFMVVQIRSQFAPEPTARGYYGGTFPNSLAVAMVRAHDRSAKSPAQSLTTRGSDPTPARALFSKSVGVMVAAVDFGQGWQYQGAGMCQLDGQNAAQLLYTRGADSVSVFSLRAPPSCAGGSGTYKQIVDDHPIAGVISNGAVYCVVGSDPSGKMTTQDLEPLLSSVEADVAEHGCAGETNPITAIILRG